MFISSFRCCLFSAFIFGSYHISSNAVITNLTQMVVNLPSDERYEQNSQVESERQNCHLFHGYFYSFIIRTIRSRSDVWKKSFFFIN